MSGQDTKRPQTREEFTRALTEAARKVAKARSLLKGKVAKPTISGTAKLLNIHRDTLYGWLNEFSVDFNEIADTVSTAQTMWP